MKRIVLKAITVAIALLLIMVTGASAHTTAARVCAVATPGHADCDASLQISPHTAALTRPSERSLASSGRKAHDATGSAAQPAAGSPQWLQQAYDLTALSASNGTGDTIAIVDAYDDPAIASDLAIFRRTYGLPACDAGNGCLRVVNEQGAVSPLPAASEAWATEETIDIDAASSICPNCSLLLVEASSSSVADLETAMQSATNLGANQISDSWSITSTSSPFPANLVTANAANGVVPEIFAASGDVGTDSPGQAQYPAALPTVTAVGGTTLSATSSTSNPRGYSESAWSNAGSGCDPGEQPLSYQPLTGCSGRAYADVSADADPMSGLNIYQASEGGWAVSGGTSLATPIVAAFAAVTGVNASTPQWAYSDAPALNDPTGGSNGACAGTLQALMCNAGAGYDGPTGVGSVSGDVVAGEPGIAGPMLQTAGQGTNVESVSQSSAQLVGGVYTNQQATSVVWQYGTTAGYGQQTAAQSLPAGLQPSAVTAALSGLQPNTTYHYRLVATNASGPSYGYDMTFTTSPNSSTSGIGANVSYVSTSSPETASKKATKTAGLGWLGRHLAAVKPIRVVEAVKSLR